MSDAPNPMIDDFTQEQNPRRQALLLLRMPDAVLASSSYVLQVVCQECEPLKAFFEARLATMLSVRDGNGNLPHHLVNQLVDARAQLKAFATGPPPLEATTGGFVKA